jgi:hypothetical protein
MTTRKGKAPSTIPVLSALRVKQLQGDVGSDMDAVNEKAFL